MSNSAFMSVDEILNTAMVHRGSDIGWDQLALFYEAHSLYYGDDVPLRVGIGETASPKYVQMRARVLFLQTLYRLVPDSTAILLTDEAYRYFDEWTVAMSEWSSHVLMLHTSGTLTEENGPYNDPSVQAAGEALADHISEWRRQFFLDVRLTGSPPADWIHDSAFFTLVAARRYVESTGEPYDGPLVPREAFGSSVHEGKRTRRELPAKASGSTFIDERRFAPPHKVIDVPVSLKDLRYPPYEDQEGNRVEDDGKLGIFDPRTETIDETVKRLLPELETRLRARLTDIAKEDLTRNGALKPIRYRKATAFEWLVRFQSLGESQSDIAKADGVDRPGVTRAVNKTANQIGLTLRKEKGGRPKKKRARVVIVT